jgi:hypothetical protein
MRRLVRTLLIAGALSIAAAVSIYLVRNEPPTSIGFSFTGENRSDRSHTLVNLTFKEFHPGGNLFTGSVVIEGEDQSLDQKRADFKEIVVLRFDHYESESNRFMYQGGSDDPITLAFPPAWGSFMGKGTFSWAGVPQPGPFFYPFDSYVLKIQIHPSLIQLSDFHLRPIDAVVTDFGGSNFIPRRVDLYAHAPNDLYEIILRRPLLLQLLASIVAALLFIWLNYLIWFAKPEEYAGNVVTLFVGVFSIRTSLLSGAPVFPGFIDYCALGVYLSAALIVLIKWLIPDKKTKECMFCKSSIPLAATICPHCTMRS